MTNLVGLREELDGELLVPDSPGYEAVRRPANPAYRDVHPRLVIRCGSVADVPDTATAFVHRRELLFSSTSPGRPALTSTGRGASIRTSPTRNWMTGPGAYHAGNYPRLAAAKKAYDPDRLFEFPQSI
jgi:Berberine and berberine like